jgi:outer membrane protein assembly factor BamB
VVGKNLLQFGLGISLIGIGSASTARAEDWPTFRGADRTALSSETNLLDSWGSDGPELVWSAVGAGKGYSSPAVSDGKIYTLGDGDSDEYLTCFDEKSGKQLWQTPTGPAWNEHKQESWNGARGTPTVDGDLVYVISPFGILLCAQTSDGEEKWTVDLKVSLGGKKKDSWGYGESALVDGDLLLCTPGGAENTLVALNKKTGELVWSCQRPGDVGAGHSSIVISHVAGKKIYVQNTGGGPMGVDAETGKLLWSFDMAPPTAFIPTAIIKDDFVFSVAGYGLGGVTLQQVPGENGEVSVKQIFDVKPELGNKHGGLILIGDKLYGGKEDKNSIFCADLETGEIMWQARGAGDGSTSVIAADGKLFLRYQNGIVTMAKVDPEAFVEVSSFKTPGSGERATPSWAHPVIANGKLILREGDAILCYNISK